MFYSIGDMGAGQFGNAGQPIHAQNKNDYKGKFLRFNTEPDNTTYPLIVSEKENAKAMGDAYSDPLITPYPNSNAFLTKLFEDRLKGNEDRQWPSEIGFNSLSSSPRLRACRCSYLVTGGLYS